MKIMLNKHAKNSKHDGNLLLLSILNKQSFNLISHIESYKFVIAADSCCICALGVCCVRHMSRHNYKYQV